VVGRGGHAPTRPGPAAMVRRGGEPTCFQRRVRGAARASGRERRGCQQIPVGYAWARTGLLMIFPLTLDTRHGPPDDRFR
jgi:hypothetical protein